MLELLKLLWREGNKVIRGAPLQFAVVCALSLIIAFIFWYGVFETKLHLASETIEQYQKNHDSFTSAVKESSSVSPQVMVYTNDPNVEKLIPQTTNAPALAYSMDGTKSTYGWDIKSQSWK